MKTCTRFFLRLLLPPFYAALGFVGYSVAFEATQLHKAVTLFGMVAFFGYILAGIPALLFATVMMRVEKRRGAGACLVNATLLGGLSGAAIGALTRDMLGLGFFGAIGLAVGALVEATVILLKRRAAAPANSLSS